MGYGKDRLWIKQFRNESKTFGDLWIPVFIALLLERSESVFHSFSIENKSILSNTIDREWGNLSKNDVLCRHFWIPVRLKLALGCFGFEMGQEDQAIQSVSWVKKNPRDAIHADRN